MLVAITKKKMKSNYNDFVTKNNNNESNCDNEQPSCDDDEIVEDVAEKRITRFLRQNNDHNKAAGRKGKLH